jgi:hypothetical protein
MQRRFAIGLGVATAIHVATIASLRAPRTAPIAPRAEDVIEIVTAPEPQPPPASVASVAPVPAPPSIAPRSTPVAGAHAPVTAAPPPDPAPPTDAVVAAPAGSAWSAWSLVMKNGAAPSAAASPPSAPPAASRDVQQLLAPPPVSTTGGLREALAARDQDLGLGSGGPVVAVAEDAASRSRTPVNGVAVLIASFGIDGAVAEVRVVDANGDRTAWDEVATSIAQGMKARRVKVPPGAHGVEVTVRVETRWQNPDGSDPDPYKVCIVGIPCNAGPHRRTIVISPLGIGGSIDPSSAAPPLRVVHARVVHERAM